VKTKIYISCCSPPFCLQTWAPCSRVTDNSKGIGIAGIPFSHGKEAQPSSYHLKLSPRARSVRLAGSTLFHQVLKARVLSSNSCSFSGTGVTDERDHGSCSDPRQVPSSSLHCPCHVFISLPSATLSFSLVTPQLFHLRKRLQVWPLCQARLQVVSSP
jgi:hypothetical protein